MSRSRWLTVMAAAGLLVAACGDDSGGEGAAESTTSTTSATTTSTEPEELGFDETVLPDAIVNDGDAAGVVVDPAAQNELDEIWSPTEFPAELAAYEGAGFVDAMFVTFGDDTPEFGGFNAAHRFEDAEGAVEGTAVLDAWHRVPANVAMAFGLEADDLPTLEELDVAVGDQVSAFLHSGPVFQVAVIVWQTDNLAHVLRAAMPAGDTDRVALVQTLAESIDARLSD